MRAVADGWAKTAVDTKVRDAANNTLFIISRDIVPR
jgi:hypothetical protein